MKTPKLQVYVHFGNSEYQAEEGIPSLFSGRNGNEPTESWDIECKAPEEEK